MPEIDLTALDPDDVYHSARSIQHSLLSMCKTWARLRSKDPNTKVGAVVYDPVSGASFYGYNGFNPGVPDYKAVWDNRDDKSPLCKYRFVRHAEANAIEKAWKCIGDLSKCQLVVTHLPCPACMKDWIVPSWIRTVYYECNHYNDPQTWIQAEIANVHIHRITEESP